MQLAVSMDDLNKLLEQGQWEVAQKLVAEVGVVEVRGRGDDGAVLVTGLLEDVASAFRNYALPHAIVWPLWSSCSRHCISWSTMLKGPEQPPLRAFATRPGLRPGLLYPCRQTANTGAWPDLQLRLDAGGDQGRPHGHRAGAAGRAAQLPHPGP